MNEQQAAHNIDLAALARLNAGARNVWNDKEFQLSLNAGLRQAAAPTVAVSQQAQVNALAGLSGYAQIQSPMQSAPLVGRGGFVLARPESIYSRIARLLRPLAHRTVLALLRRRSRES